MRKEVKLVFGPGKEIDLAVDASEVLSFEASRQWLDEQFVRLGCEPMRGSGKVLVADKILSVAAAAGLEGFQDAAFALDYARAASGALSKALLRIDIPKHTLSY
ncbi:hypothetical protein [Pelomonas sp. SE-A7]|uniref:hypothetical protein n=1 Tax=Pelomonas sp. SE-A7 TaxID=3054953 RepID=UPI00259D0777|nr:hypothetical protein [Pelomonas sp. SE-A7]MDM4766447.1 hypothetical protein [Pelomonas sp. SE-A7]